MVSSYSHFTTPLNLKRIANPFPYFGLLAYKRSKLCNVLFTYEFNRRHPELSAFAVDPGLVNTGIASKGGHGISHLVWKNRRYKGDPPELPAQTLLYLVAEPNIDTSQGYYFKNCTYKEPSKKSRREDLAAELWDLSLELTGIK
jgi:NAD(P)-dependent dehydrogenase (short-subunit alcohol dehydrogenase family)